MQSFGHQSSVLIQHGNDICRRRNRNQIQKRIWKASRMRKSLGVCTNQFVAHPASAKSRKGIITISSFGIEQCIGIGQLPRFMVITHNHINAMIPAQLNALAIFGATIQGDHQVLLLINGVLRTCYRKSIPFFVSIGNVELNICS